MAGSGMEMLIATALKAMGFDKAKVEALALEKLAEAKAIVASVIENQTRVEGKIDMLLRGQDMILGHVSGDKPAAPFSGSALALMEPEDALSAISQLHAEKEADGTGDGSNRRSH